MAIGGRLTLNQNDATPIADASGSTLYYVPTEYGNEVPLYGSADGLIHDYPFTSSLLDLGPSLPLGFLGAGHAADIYMAYNAGVPVLCSATWTADPGTPQPSIGDVLIQGRTYNANAFTGHLADGTQIDVPQYQGLYLGSVCCGNTDGIVTCNVSYGPNRWWGVWNAYNQRDILVSAGPNQYSWYGEPGWVNPVSDETWSPFAPNGVEGQAVVFVGRPAPVDVIYKQNCWRQMYNGNSAIAEIGIGLNNALTPSGYTATFDFESFVAGNCDGASAQIAAGQGGEAHLNVPNQQGAWYYRMLFQTKNVAPDSYPECGTSVVQLNGQQGDCEMLLRFKA